MEGHDIKHIIYVKHNKNGKFYVFEVPDGLTRLLTRDMKVRLETTMGVQTGTTTTGVISGTENAIRDIAKISGASFPLKKVLSVRINLSDIKITKYFKQKPPNPEKIKTCYAFYRYHKRLDRDLVVDANKCLVDGYVGYLVAKMFGIRNVYVTAA